MTGKIAIVIGRCGTRVGTLVHQDNEKVVLRNARIPEITQHKSYKSD